MMFVKKLQIVAFMLQQMQKDTIFTITNSINYPWVNRLDRNVYQKYPQLDPAQLALRSLVAVGAGYWFGIFTQRNKILFAALASLPIFAHYLFQEWRLSKELKPFSQLEFNIGKKLPLKKMQQMKLQAKQKRQSTSKQFKNIRSIPDLEGKILEAKDFTSQLPHSYFRST